MLIDDVVLDHALDVLVDMDEAWEHLTCREADGLLALLVAAGRPHGAAIMLALGHAPGDDEGDLHGGLLWNPDGTERDPDQVEVLALAYVTGLISRPHTEED